MPSQESVADIKLQITGLGVCYKNLEVGNEVMQARSPKQAQLQLDPERVEVCFADLGSENPNQIGNLQKRRSEMNRLNLMVGDVVSIKIAKE